ncbi:hypothetical protein OG500_36795 [Kitasatospora sp. NBC_01250]|uniref:hypothetical protein n=1 Tax=Kitasatospora sp. NBC_01250 TaxID=2903571 RepID=UPI002E34F36C|nr:hypothetical protein [Kitasatospora sp. NBC_01250]
MSFLGMWCLVPMKAEAITRYAPELRPAIEDEAAHPTSKDLLRWWQEVGSTEASRHDFVESAAPSALDERICLVYEAWNHGRDESLPYLAASARNSFPAAALAFALGPERFAQLPGWFGDLILTPAQVRDTLPAVEHAFTWSPQSRPHAEHLLTAALRDEGTRADIDTLLDGVPPVWRAAAEAGRGLLGAHFVP